MNVVLASSSPGIGKTSHSIYDKAQSMTRYCYELVPSLKVVYGTLSWHRQAQESATLLFQFLLDTVALSWQRLEMWKWYIHLRATMVVEVGHGHNL